MKRIFIFSRLIILLYFCLSQAYAGPAAIITVTVSLPPPSKPSLGTVAASNIMAETAYLGGNVMATNGSPVSEWGIYWGTNSGSVFQDGTNYSQSGTFDTGAFSFFVTNLPAGRTNYFLAYAVNGQGTNFTAEGSFLTRPTAPGMLPSTNITTNALCVNWQSAEGSTNYLLDVASTNDFAVYLAGYSNRAVGAELTFAVTGLETLVVYYYRVRSENATGMSTSSVMITDITLPPPNNNPTAVNDTATLAENSSATAINVLANDSCLPDIGETLSIKAVTQGAHGTVVITGGGAGLTYQPGANYSGSDTFTYTISDGNGGTATATVSVTVTLVVLKPISVQIITPTATATYTSLTNSPNLGGTASDNAGVTRITLRNSRDVAGFTCTGTTNWLFNNLPLFQGENFLDAVAYNAAGDSATGLVQITYSGDAQYDDVLRSGNIVQAITFPDGLGLIPGTIVPVQWKILSYVPIVCRIYAGVPGTSGWSFFQNGIYQGVTNSPWNLNGRHANIYSFDCAWPVPQKSGGFNAWFNVAQMDGDQFMIPVIPDGVDSRPDPTYTKLIQRTISAGGNETNSQSGPDNWDSARIFETVDQHKERSAATITSITLPDNLAQGTQATCIWKVQSYVDINAQLLVLNFATSNLWLTANATRIGTPADTTFNFQDRTTGLRYYAKEYTFQATFTVPNKPGKQQIYFRSQDSANPASLWMAENLGANVDSQPVLQNGMYGRMIERTIIP